MKADGLSSEQVLVQVSKSLGMSAACADIYHATTVASMNHETGRPPALGRGSLRRQLGRG